MEHTENSQQPDEANEDLKPPRYVSPPDVLLSCLGSCLGHRSILSCAMDG